MNKLTKAQKDQLIGVVMGTLALVGLLWYFGVAAAQDDLSKTERNTAQMKDTLDKAERQIRMGPEVAEELTARTNLLAKKELLLAPDRDAYAWIIGTMNEFLKNRKGVNLSSYSKPDVSDYGVIPNFPYKWATFHLGGSGYYQELGKFFADLENGFPAFKVENVEISANTVVGGEAERLSVRFDLVVPIKPPDTK